jgi:hypothetical protein
MKLKKNSDLFDEITMEVEDVMKNFFIKKGEFDDKTDFDDLQKAVNDLEKEIKCLDDKTRNEIENSGIDFDLPINSRDKKEIKERKLAFQRLKAAAMFVKEEFYNSLSFSIGNYWRQNKDSKLELVTRIVISMKLFKSVDITEVTWAKFFEEYFENWSRKHQSYVYIYRTERTLKQFLIKEGKEEELEEHVKHMTAIYLHFNLGDYSFPDEYNELPQEELKKLRMAALPQVLHLRNNRNVKGLKRDKMWFKMLFLCITRDGYVQKIINGEIVSDDGSQIFDKLGNYHSVLSEKYSDIESITENAKALTLNGGNPLNAVVNFGIKVSNKMYARTEAEIEEVVKILKTDKSNEPDLTTTSVARQSSKRSRKPTKKFDEYESGERIDGLTKTSSSGLLIVKLLFQIFLLN